MTLQTYYQNFGNGFHILSLRLSPKALSEAVDQTYDPGVVFYNAKAHAYNKKARLTCVTPQSTSKAAISPNASDTEPSSRLPADVMPKPYST